MKNIKLTSFFLAAIIMVPAFALLPVMAQEMEGLPTPPTADSLNAPPLPTLPKGEWKPEATVFPGALVAADKDGNLLDTTVDLSGTKYSAHLEYHRRSDNPDDDLIDNIASAYDKALADKGYDYQAALPGSAMHVAGAMADSSQGGVAGELVLFNDKIRFIAITTNEPGSESDEAETVPKEADVNGDIEIFISDEISVADVLQKISAAKAKKETPGPKS